MSSPPSKALEHKLKKQRELAPFELPKARLCANVIVCLFRDEADFDLSVAELKAALGANWSHVTAIQFMSGHQGLFCAESARPDEQEPMRLAHRLAVNVCNQVMHRALSFRELRAIALASVAQGGPKP